MSRFDAIIIGGGVNGLVAATVLGKQGKSVCIVEKAETFGGMASLSMDGGPALAHTLYNLSPRVLKDLGINPNEAPIDGPALSTVSLSDDGNHIVFKDGNVGWSDGTSHPQSAAWGDLTGLLADYGNLLRQLAEAPPPGGASSLLSQTGLKQMVRLAKLGIGLKKMGKLQMRRFLQVMLSNVFDLILDDMPDGPVAGMLAADAVRGLAAGPRSPGTVFNLIYRMGHGGVVTHPLGGMSAVTDLLVSAARQAGCTLMPGTGVTRILVEGDTATGVSLENGETLPADLVLSSLGPQLTAHLVGAVHFDIEASRRIRNVRSRGTTAKVNFKLKDDAALPGLSVEHSSARLIYAPSAEYVELAFNPAKYREMSKAPVIEAIKTTAADGSQWLSAIVQYAPSDLDGGWTQEAQTQLSETTLNTLSRCLPGFSEMVDSTQVITPDMIEAQTGAPGGHWHHAEMALDQLLSIRPTNGMGHHALGPKGVYLCGASTHPGGDVMGLAGRNAANKALEELA
ncbi:MAG: phytoene desaturase family protein [Paracoccaceae bacterium]